MRKTAYIIAVTVGLILLLGACNQGTEENPPEDTMLGLTDPVMTEEAVTEPDTTEQAETEPVLTESGPIERQDVDGLATVRIENGKATLAYHVDKWDEMFQIRSIESRFEEPLLYPEGPFPIETIQGNVIDACLGFVDYSVDSLEGQPYPDLTIALIMDDGAVEYLYGDPATYYDVTEVYSFDRIPYLQFISALSYENDGEGIGSQTIYAIDEGHQRFDIRIPMLAQYYEGIFWETTLTEGDENYDPVRGFLSLDGAGRVEYIIGANPNLKDAEYFGTYRIILGENDPSGKPGSLVLDMTLDDYYKNEDGSSDLPAQITGTYFVGLDENFELNLWLSDGDSLYENPMSDEESFHFTYAVPPGDLTWSDEDFVNYLLDNVFEAQQMVEQGMSAMVTGDVTYIDGVGNCKNVVLGTNSEDQFVRELLYTISEQGMIYQYNVITGEWDYLPPAVG